MVMVVAGAAGVALGARSPRMATAEILQLLKQLGEDSDSAHSVQRILVRRPSKLPRAAVCARLAPHVAACSVLLAPAEPAGDTGDRAGDAGDGAGDAGDGAGAWRAVCVRAVPPGEELRVWAAPALLAAAAVPHLTPQHITTAGYVCARCRWRSAEPYPLKAHLLLSCSPPRALPFWRHVLGSASAPAPACDELAARAAETLAAAWARARGERGHPCPYCGRRYSRAYGLRLHVRTHTGYRPLRCSSCARSFSDPSNLNKHRRLHARKDSACRDEGVKLYIG